MPQMLSARPNAGRVGGPSGRAGEVGEAAHRLGERAETGPRRRTGPVCPNPVSRTRIRPGLTSCSRSGPRPQRSSVPGRKFSTSDVGGRGQPEEQPRPLRACRG